ncbi:hypothetical protein CALK_2397 [Chitinivibrio alkaliphilus ACht1]|uniref:Uncharacterized protein n=1 Tax=Chitinivibrio alkaliphilus ACht1 TaxID=1313304 RepID=U7D8J7_9BACT|nr:hypothetical protein CALK_2397 [Chitinivibrio alkaliphilus ACht1]
MSPLIYTEYSPSAEKISVLKILFTENSTSGYKKTPLPLHFLKERFSAGKNVYLLKETVLIWKEPMHISEILKQKNHPQL